MTLLDVKSVSKTFRGQRQPAVSEVTFSVARGEAVGVVGESGSGKSTTARIAAGLIRSDSGTVEFEGVRVTGKASPETRQVRQSMQMVFQDPFAYLNPRMTVEELVEEGLVVHGLERSRRARRERVVEVLGMVGLERAHLRRYPRSFSGGQRQRIAIARAMAVNPKLLICDEPVSSLDVSVQAQVLNLLRDLQERLGLSILFIAHDLAVVRYLCDRVIVMNGGKIVESGTREEVYERPSHPYTNALLAAVPVPDPAFERQRRISRNRRITQ